jgi:hypothetical protein
VGVPGKGSRVTRRSPRLDLGLKTGQRWRRRVCAVKHGGGGCGSSRSGGISAGEGNGAARLAPVSPRRGEEVVSRWWRLAERGIPRWWQP